MVALAWEVNRLRRLKAGLLRLEQREALATVLQKAMPYREAQTLAIEWSAGLERAQKEVDRTFSQWNLDMDVVMATALNTKLDKIEQIDRMLNMASARRDAVLREIERRRDSLAARIRQAPIDVTDVEVT